MSLSSTRRAELPDGVGRGWQGQPDAIREKTRKKIGKKPALPLLRERYTGPRKGIAAEVGERPRCARKPVAETGDREIGL